MRRRTLLALAALPVAARAQTPPATSPSPPARPLSTTGIDKTRAYYLFFDAAIDVATTNRLRTEVANLVEAGVTEIAIVISSRGGAVDPAIQTYGFLRALPVPVRTHAQGFVQSAANLIFLAGETRTADRSARFLFHPISVNLTAGSDGEQQAQERLMNLQMFESAIAQIYQARTKLADADIHRFERETVVMNAEQAQAAGLVSAVADLRLPPDRAKVILIT